MPRRICGTAEDHRPPSEAAYLCEGGKGDSPGAGQAAADTIAELEELDWDNLLMNRALVYAYLKAREDGLNDHLSGPDLLHAEDVPAFLVDCRQYGVLGFTISVRTSSLPPVLNALQQAGASRKGIVLIFHRSGHRAEACPAIRIEVSPIRDEIFPCEPAAAPIQARSPRTPGFLPASYSLFRDRWPATESFRSAAPDQGPVPLPSGHVDSFFPGSFQAPPA